MRLGTRQIVAQMVSSTVRVLELLEFDYQVTGPQQVRQKGNHSPRLVHVDIGEGRVIKVYNGIDGYTWANGPDGPIPAVKSPETLYAFLAEFKASRGQAVADEAGNDADLDETSEDAGTGPA